MKLPRVLTLCSLAVVVAIAGCSGSSDSGSATAMPPEDTDESTPDQTTTDPTDTGSTATTARYRLRFEATWSGATHITDFPGNPHFSPLTGAVHNQQVVFWSQGQNASDGIEVMAETGGVSTFVSEVNAAIDEGYASAVINGGGVATSPGEVSVEFEVSIDNPLITVVSMLAPSPDWFVGLHNVALHDGQQFLASLTQDLALYDAGTDSGQSYTSANSDTQPPDPIDLVSNPTGTPFDRGMPFVGRFVIEKL